MPGKFDLSLENDRVTISFNLRDYGLKNCHEITAGLFDYIPDNTDLSIVVGVSGNSIEEPQEAENE